MRLVPIQRYQELRRRAVRGGANRRSHAVIDWSLYGQGRHQCERHLAFEVRGETDRGDKTREWIEYQVRCRKCSACRRARTALWRVRSQAEVVASNAAWMGTFTLNDESLYVLETAARLRLAAAAVSLPEDRTALEYFRAVERQGYAALTRFWKRLRKRGFQIRYFLVAEPHDGPKTADYRRGVPHWHALISMRGRVADCNHANDQQMGCPPLCECRCLPCTMKREWQLGFSDFKRIEDTPVDRVKAAAYVAKYISKTMIVRIRASHRYGKHNMLCFPSTTASAYSMATYVTGKTRRGNDPTEAGSLESDARGSAQPSEASSLGGDEDA